MRRFKLTASIAAFVAFSSEARAMFGMRGPADEETLVWILALAFTSAAFGKRLLSRPSAVFLGGVGGTIAAGVYYDLTGAVFGLLVGSLVAVIPWFRRNPRGVPESGHRFL